MGIPSLIYVIGACTRTSLNHPPLLFKGFSGKETSHPPLSVFEVNHVGNRVVWQKNGIQLALSLQMSITGFTSVVAPCTRRGGWLRMCGLARLATVRQTDTHRF